MASIGIVGAGISGLTTALAIARTHCHQVTLYEAGQLEATAPLPLHLPPNATRVLKALGLEPGLQDQVHQAQRQQIRTSKQGFQLADLPLGALAEARYNAPYYTTSQDRLRHLLVQALPAEVALQAGQRCVRVDPQLGRLELSNGEPATHDLVVIADGADSSLRQQLGFEVFRSASAMQLTLGTVAASTELAQTPPSGITQWIGANRWFSHWPVDEAGGLGFAAVSEASTNQTQLAESFDGWHPMVGNILTQGQPCASQILTQQQPLPVWLQGRAVLLGDAAHPTLPFTDQSAALGVEDAWILSRMLEQQEAKPIAAAEEYQRFRLRRCQRVQEFGAKQGLNLQEDGMPAILRRNLKLGLGSRFLPEMALATFDWLYGYDCVRGFH